jgi:uncharacterized protein YbcI
MLKIIEEEHYIDLVLDPDKDSCEIEDAIQALENFRKKMAESSSIAASVKMCEVNDRLKLKVKVKRPETQLELKKRLGEKIVSLSSDIEKLQNEKLKVISFLKTIEEL